MLHRFLFSLAVIIGKLAIHLSRKLHLGGGSSFPGRLALRLYPGLIREFAAAFPDGVVLVTATNGKTTTTRMIAAGLHAAAQPFVYNISGANMAGGIATALIEYASWRGGQQARLGLFEVDEGSFPAVAAELVPDTVLVGNFFRDQLDRYGEVAILVNRIREALQALPRAPRLVLNADDPMTASLARDWAGEVLWFGLDDREYGFNGLQEDADIRHCPLCHTFLEYNVAYVGHLGDFSCPGCGFQRPEPDFQVTSIALDGISGQSFILEHRGERVPFSLALPGEHAVYNMLGAAAVLSAVSSLKLADLAAIFRDFQAPYGRFEIFEVKGRRVYLILVKNPAGANVILRLLRRLAVQGPFLFLLNDLSADGRDISWIYDADFESLADLGQAFVSGRRAADMYLRLVYAGVPEDRLVLVAESGEALDALLESPGEQPLFVIATYTAMHDVRAELGQRTEVRDFWKE